MNNCLVTKLNATVSNDNLKPLGMGVVHFNTFTTVPSDYNILSLEFDKNTSVKLISDDQSVQFYSNKARTTALGTTVNFSANVKKTIYASNGNFDVLFEKYSLTSFDCGGITDCSNMVIDISSFYCSKIKLLQVPYKWVSGSGDTPKCAKWSGKLSDLPSTLQFIKIGLSGDSNFYMSDCNHLTNVLQLNINGPGIYGDLDTDIPNLTNVSSIGLEFAKNITCTTLKYVQLWLAISQVNLGYANVSGPIEIIFEKMYTMLSNGDGGRYVATNKRNLLTFKNVIPAYENMFAYRQNDVLKVYGGGLNAQTATVLLAEYDGTTWTYLF